MRIIAGKYGGRKLVSFKADHIRPTTDRVKEAIFNKVQFEIDGARILDLFAGTGNLSFEALSRGAREVWAVESSAKSIQVIKRNQSLLGVGDELNLFQMDVFKFLGQLNHRFDLIFIDPPFTKKMASEVLEALSKVECLGAGVPIFIESSSQESVKEEYGPLKMLKQKSYGDKKLSYYQIP